MNFRNKMETQGTVYKKKRFVCNSIYIGETRKELK